MRIGLVTSSSRRAGGVETYLEAVASAFGCAGHEVSLWAETDEPSNRSPIALPAGAPSFDLRASLNAALDWRPDVLLVNGLGDVALETRLLRERPSVFVAHNFYGTCISGIKAWAFPTARPCHREFGWPCLIHYFPHRCGGLSPATMLRLYGRERNRRTGLASAGAIVTLSTFMREEYVRHGFDPARVVCLPYGPAAPPVESTPRAPRADVPRSLIAIGRLEPIKGFDLLIDALPRVRQSLGRPVALTIVGDGPERADLERRARSLGSIDGLTVTFTGWVTPAERDRHLRLADLLVVPSTWPEPLGLVGLEAAGAGVPAAAFDVGGIRDWLVDGETGAIAPGDPPTSGGLAAAITACLRDESRLARFRAAARALAAKRSPGEHAAGLLRIFDGFVEAPQPSRAKA
jgi:glycosyltransferase involved in cell wall biosynthesis